MSADSTHSHPSYLKIYVVLLLLLVVSLVGPTFGILAVTLVTAFGVAIVKATMVASWFMHLSTERRYITYVLLAMVAFLVVLFAGVAPDVLSEGGTNWRHIAEVRVPPPPHE